MSETRTPLRIQRKRTKGWRMPDGAVSVTRPGRFGNPFRAGINGVRFDNCLSMHETYCLVRLRGEPEWLEPLRGKDLACFCKEGAPCHADVLLRLANA